MMMTLRKSGS